MEDSRELISFITDPADDDDQYIDTYLADNGIDHKGFRENILSYLKEKKAEVLINKGRRFKEKFYNLLWDDPQFKVYSEAEFALGFRKLEELEEGEMDDIKEDELKLRLLQELVKGRGEV